MKIIKNKKIYSVPVAQLEDHYISSTSHWFIPIWSHILTKVYLFISVLRMQM